MGQIVPHHLVRWCGTIWAIGSLKMLERPLLAYEKAAHPLAVRRGGLLMVGLCGLLAAVLSWVSFVSRVY